MVTTDMATSEMGKTSRKEPTMMPMRSDERLAKRIAKDIISRYDPLSILDVGCGDGIISENIKEDVIYQGLDIVNACIYEQNHNNPRVRYIEATQVATGMQVGSPWEMVLLLDVIEHTPDFTSLFTNAMKNSSNYVIVSLPNELFFLERLRMLWGKELPAHSLDLVGMPEGFKHQFIINIRKAEKLLSAVALEEGYELVEEIVRPLIAKSTIKRGLTWILEKITSKDVWSMGSVLVYKKKGHNNK